MTGNTAPSGLCSAWREGGQFTIPNAWKAFDRSYDDPYSDGVFFTAYGANAPVIIQYQTQCFTTFNSFEIWHKIQSSSYVTEKWRDFTFETSDDGVNWTVRKTVTDATWIDPAGWPHNTFTLDAEVTAKFVRWVVTKTWDASVNSLCLLKECRLLLE